MKILDILLDANLIKSKSEGRRLIEQGAVRWEPEFVGKEPSKWREWYKVEDNLEIPFSGYIKVGKHRFLKVNSDFRLKSIKNGVQIV